MDFTEIYRNKSSSAGPKILLSSLHLIIFFIVVWILLGHGIFSLEDATGVSPTIASGVRRIMLVIAAGLYFIRTLCTVFVLMKRKMPWAEAGFVGLWIGVVHLLFAYFGGKNPAPAGLMEIIGIILLITGSIINTGSEWQRHHWKRDPAHAGHLYTGGMFGYAQHINYFGDDVLFFGWSLITGQLWLLIIPAAMLCGFVFINIPALDAHLDEHYGNEYRTYVSRVKRFIPFIY